MLNLSSRIALLSSVVALSLPYQHVQAQADIAAGKSVFAQCAGCHTIGPQAVNRFGPQLNGLMQRGAGGVADFQYSTAFNKAVEEGMTWEEGTALDEYLTSPMQRIPGTKMAYAGLSSAEDRANVIAYLSSIALDGSPQGVADNQNNGEATSQLDASETQPKQSSEKHSQPPVTEPKILAKDMPVPEHGVLHLGRPAMQEEIQAWDIDIRPDGTGLPEGSGSVADGTVLYDAQCAACHGVFGEGEGRWPALSGGFGTLTDDRPEKTIGSYWPYLSTVYDYVRRAMPFGNARSLSDDDVYALTAYLLYLNDIVDDSFVLDSSTFKEITMPNADNFIADNRDTEQNDADFEPCMQDCFADAAKVVMRARVLDVTPDNEEPGAEGTQAID